MVLPWHAPTPAPNSLDVYHSANQQTNVVVLKLQEYGVCPTTPQALSLRPAPKMPPVCLGSGQCDAPVSGCVLDYQATTWMLEQRLTLVCKPHGVWKTDARWALKSAL